MEFTISWFDVWTFVIYMGSVVITYCIFFAIFWWWRGNKIIAREIEINNGVYELTQIREALEIHNKSAKRYIELIADNQDWIEKGRLYDKEKLISEYYRVQYYKQIKDILLLEDKVKYLENQLEKSSRLRSL